MTISLTTTCIRPSIQTVLIAATSFLKPFSFNCGHLLREVGRPALRLHGDQADVGLGQLVEGALQLVVVDVAEVIFEHHLIEPADLGDDLEDLGQHGVVAAQPGEADLARPSSGPRRPP